jgi:hypothetical protein
LGLFTKDAVSRIGQGASFDFSVDGADRGKSLGISFDFSAFTTNYATGDLRVYVYDVTNGTLITPSSVNIAGGSGTFSASFISTQSQSYRLIMHVATGNTLAYTVGVDNFRVGPFETLLGMAGSDPITTTPSTAGWTNTTASLRSRRVGNFLHCRLTLSFTGAPTSPNGNLRMTGAELLNGLGGLTVDTSNVFNGYVCAGPWEAADTGVTNYTGGLVKVRGDAPNGLVVWLTTTGEVSPTVPFSFGNTDTITGEFAIPIANWSANVQMADRAVEEYASNSSTTDADDTTSFANGIAGSAVPTIALAATGSRLKTVRFQSPIQATDALIFEVQLVAGGTWLPNRVPVVSSNTAIYGVFLAAVNSTDVNVHFGRAGATANGAATYGATGESWTTFIRWRVRKVSGGAAVGFPVGARNIVGDPAGTAVPAGYLGEQIRSVVTTNTNFAATNAYADAASMTLTPGVWDISTTLYSTANGATVNQVDHFIGTVSGNNSTGRQLGDNAFLSAGPTTAADVNGSISAFRVLVTTSTIYYLKVRGIFTVATPQYQCRISAVRVG